jgi:GntR family transcriptional regulator, transcriptional repressor for pyruvate dehydrogenase complex
MNFQELTRQTLADQAADSIRNYIVTHELKPGAMLPAAGVLATQLGVSRSVIREALKALVGQNTIEIINGKGAVIKPVDSQDLDTFFQRALGFDHKAIRELLEVRQGIEVQAARLAAQRRTEQDLEALSEILERMQHHFQNVEAYTADDLTFHICIATATDNEMMKHIVESIRDATWDSIHRWHGKQRTIEEYAQVHQMHVEILDAIRAGSPETAAQAMWRHFDEALFDLDHSD